MSRKESEYVADCDGCGRKTTKPTVENESYRSCSYGRMHLRPDAPARLPEEPKPDDAETEECRRLALSLNDTVLNREPVSVNQIRHILRAARSSQGSEPT